jgi:hypothetical protein
MSGEPAIRNARPNARRRIAACRQSASGCNHAPRPGIVLAASTITTLEPFPVPLALSTAAAQDGVKAAAAQLGVGKAAAQASVDEAAAELVRGLAEER